MQQQIEPELMQQAMAQLAQESAARSVSEPIISSADGKIARCPYCDCRIIDISNAQQVQKEVCISREYIGGGWITIKSFNFLAFFTCILQFTMEIPALLGSPLLAPPTPETTFWLANQWSYDNIGVSKPPTADSSFRFLTCADCDRGPFGVTFPKDEPEMFYLCSGRVKYTA